MQNGKWCVNVLNLFFQTVTPIHRVVYCCKLSQWILRFFALDSRNKLFMLFESLLVYYNLKLESVVVKLPRPFRILYYFKQRTVPPPLGHHCTSLCDRTEEYLLQNYFPRCWIRLRSVFINKTVTNGPGATVGACSPYADLILKMVLKMYFNPVVFF